MPGRGRSTYGKARDKARRTRVKSKMGVKSKSKYSEALSAS